MKAVQRSAIHELAAAHRARYVKAGRAEKARILAEFEAASGYHRKAAVRLLRHAPSGQRRGGRPVTYSPLVVRALRTVAVALDWPCGKRLAPFLAEVVPVLEAEGAVSLTDAGRTSLLSMSAATIDRRLRQFKRELRPHGQHATRPGSLLKKQVPIQTTVAWSDQRAGFAEIDLVAHGGGSSFGHFAYTLTLTDVATGWTDCAGCLGKSQRAVFAGLEAIRARLPFPLLGIDSDNGSEFLNAHLIGWCASEGIRFTRGRPYWKNDQAHVEQKNWSIVRRLVGYDRFETEEAVGVLNAVYAAAIPWMNFWQPVRKIVRKEVVGGKTRKHYDIARTPYRRVLESGAVSSITATRLASDYAAVGPSSQRRMLDEKLERLWALAAHPNQDVG